MNENLTTILFALLPVLVVVVGVVLGLAGKWIAANVKNATVKGILLRLDDVVYTVVKEINQTVVDSARLPDGSLAPDAAEKAKAAALAKVKSYLGLEGLKLLGKIFGFGAGESTDSVILSKIEAAVHDVKLVTAATASGVAPAPVPANPR